MCIETFSYNFFKNFEKLPFTFKFLIHMEFINTYSVKIGSIFLAFRINCQNSLSIPNRSTMPILV